jgi:hypothetical protein
MAAIFINKNKVNFLFLFVWVLFSCKKILSIPPPASELTAEQIFSTDQNANQAMAGAYSELINGTGNGSLAQTLFAAGLSSFISGFSSDELVVNLPNSSITAQLYNYNTNHLFAEGLTSQNNVYSDAIWISAFAAIYDANAVINGISTSQSTLLHDSVRNELTGEAKGLRAFCYFYLANFFGDVPLLTTNAPVLQQTESRTPVSQVYTQIVSDLTAAQAALPGDFSAGGGQRIRINKWAAAALLARVYLYNKNYSQAAAQASLAIDSSSLFSLETNLGNVFLANSNEAIWQLQQDVNNNSTGNAVPEASLFLPNPLNSGFLDVGLSPQLLHAFEPGDLRRQQWVDSAASNLSFFGGSSADTFYFPFKYKTGAYNMVVGGTAVEYYMVLRLAEQYLIRAEAEANLGNTAAAIADLDKLRERAGLPDLSGSLSQAAVLAAVAHERQTELFCEWGHRWFDLKRTGEADSVLSQIALKQPWAGDYQLLYPLPYTDLLYDHNLIQNPGY